MPNNLLDLLLITLLAFTYTLTTFGTTPYIQKLHIKLQNERPLLKLLRVLELCLRQHALDGGLPDLAVRLFVQQQLHRPGRRAQRHREAPPAVDHRLAAARRHAKDLVCITTKRTVRNRVSTPPDKWRRAVDTPVHRWSECDVPPRLDHAIARCGDGETYDRRDKTEPWKTFQVVRASGRTG